MKELLLKISDEIKSITDTKEEESQIYLPNNLDYQTYTIKPENFHQMRKNALGKKIMFIDGGSCEILSSNSLSLFFVRVSAVIYQNFIKVSQKKKEFLLFSRLKNKEDNKDNNKRSLIYQTKILPINSDSIEKIEFDVKDETLKQGLNNVSISSVGNTVRRFLEIKMAKTMNKELKQGDLIVIDGNLECSITGEKERLEELFNEVHNNGVLLTALSKTNHLSTDSGIPLSSLLNKISKKTDYADKSWYYHPVVKLDNPFYPAELYMLKLHPLSKHIFKFEIHNKQKHIDIEKVFGYLSFLSQDPVFLGYPYGLIKADEIARISNEEANLIKSRLMQYIDIDTLEMNTNAHSILDNIRF